MRISDWSSDVCSSDLQEAAAVGVYHPKWDERPILLIVKKPGADVGEADILDYLKDKVAKWWLPDEIVFVDELPHTATRSEERRVGKRVSVRVDLGGRRIIKKNKPTCTTNQKNQ